MKRLLDFVLESSDNNLPKDLKGNFTENIYELKEGDLLFGAERMNGNIDDKGTNICIVKVVKYEKGVGNYYIDFLYERPLVDKSNKWKSSSTKNVKMNAPEKNNKRNTSNYFFTKGFESDSSYSYDMLIGDSLDIVKNTARKLRLTRINDELAEHDEKIKKLSELKKSLEDEKKELK